MWQKEGVIEPWNTRKFNKYQHLSPCWCSSTQALTFSHTHQYMHTHTVRQARDEGNKVEKLMRIPFPDHATLFE